MQTITLTSPAKNPVTTDISIGAGAMHTIVQLAQGYDRIVILYDEAIAHIAMKITLGDCVRISVNSGDASKSLTEVDRIVSVMLESGCARNTVLICVGGGMITDLGGFVASVFMRGIPCVLIPTTLLGMVDAAVGGKTAVNAGAKKNMIGTITQPVSVLIDTELLQSLPDAQLAEGLAEVIKIAAIIDKPFFEWLEQAMSKILKREEKALEECVTRAVTAKVQIVQTDESDTRERLLLNFGHTVGHAVEALSAYRLSHGSCVSIGIAAEMKLAGCEEASRIEKLLTAANLPLGIPSDMKPDDLWTIMLSDKKNEKGEVRIAVPKQLGEGVVIAVTKESFLTLFR